MPPTSKQCRQYVCRQGRHRGSVGASIQIAHCIISATWFLKSATLALRGDADRLVLFGDAYADWLVLFGDADWLVLLKVD